MRRTKEAADQTRQEIIQAALNTFSQRGFNDTRLDDIACEAGITRGAIYWHFKNKADLYTRLVLESLSTYKLMLVEVSGNLDSPQKQLTQLNDLLLKDLGDNSPMLRLFWKQANSSDPIPTVLKDVHESMQTFILEWDYQIEKLIQTGQEDGSFRNDLAATDLLILYKAFIWGLLDVTINHPTPFDIRDKVQQLKEIMLNILT